MDAHIVIVIDDNRARCEGLAELLQLQGFIAYSAFDGTEGLARARSMRPAALLLDLHMPGMDGIGVIAAVREDTSLRNTAIVLITADAPPAPDHGSDAFLTYPLDGSTLRAVVLGTITKRKNQNSR